MSRVHFNTWHVHFLQSEMIKCCCCTNSQVVKFTYLSHKLNLSSSGPGLLKSTLGICINLPCFVTSVKGKGSESIQYLCFCFIYQSQIVSEDISWVGHFYSYVNFPWSNIKCPITYRAMQTNSSTTPAVVLLKLVCLTLYVSLPKFTFLELMSAYLWSTHPPLELDSEDLHIVSISNIFSLVIVKPRYWGWSWGSTESSRETISEKGVNKKNFYWNFLKHLKYEIFSTICRHDW